MTALRCAWSKWSPRARREHMRKPLDLIVIDHLHLFPLPGKTRETVEIGQITAALKALAKGTRLLRAVAVAVESRR